MSKTFFCSATVLFYTNVSLTTGERLICLETLSKKNKTYTTIVYITCLFFLTQFWIQSCFLNILNK